MTTRVPYTATTSNGLYAVPFAYLDKSHVKVQVNGSDVPTSAYTWETSAAIRLPAAVGASILIYRASPTAPVTTYTAGATLTEEDLQADSLQALYRIQEVEDRHDVEIVDVDEIHDMIEQAGITGADQYIRGDLASNLGTKGAYLVAWAQPDGTAVTQNVRDELRRVVRPEHFGAVGDGTTDDSVAMDLALVASAGKTLLLTRGKTYRLATVRYGTGTALRIASNTTIIAHGATVKRGSASIAVMLSNDSNGSVGGYTANENIRIYGGTWDANYPTYAGPAQPMGFVHSQRIRIHHVYSKGSAANHHIEFNACANVLVEGCTFEGGAEQLDDTMEAIQIDGAFGSAYWGVGPYDNTTCSNIRIIGNTFKLCGSGVGSHTSVSGLTHTSIMVIGNMFTQPYFCGVRAENWEASVISNNVFYQGLHAIRARGDATTLAGGLTIANNEIFQCGATSYTGAAAGDGHAIYLFGNSALTEQVRNYSITGNVIRLGNQAKSGAGIKVNYCGSGVISGNVIDTTASGPGITLFGGGGALVNGNRVVNTGSGQTSIVVASAAAVSVNGNQAETISVTGSDKCLVLDNNVFNTSGITNTGNTNTFVKNNLVNTTWTP